MKEKQKIAILCRRPKDFFLFQNLYKRLSDAEFVVVPPLAPEFTLKDYEQRELKQYRLAAEFIARQNVRSRPGPFAVLQNDSTEMEGFFEPYALLIDTQNSFYLAHPANLNKKKILYLYEDAITGFWPNISFCNVDLVLTPGRYFNNLVAPLIPSEIVGNLYLDIPMKIPPPKLPAPFVPEKKTILYLPREELFNSPASFSGAVNELSLKYNVIVQLTQETSALGKNIKLFSLNKNITIIDETYDIRMLRDIVDLAVSDDALTVLEWLALEKKALLLDLWTQDFISRNNGPALENASAWNNNLNVAYDASGLKTFVGELLSKVQPSQRPLPEIGQFFDLENKELACERAAKAIERAMAGPPAKPSAESALVFKPGNLTIKNYNFYYRTRPFANSIDDIVREESFIKKCLKIIRVFFG